MIFKNQDLSKVKSSATKIWLATYDRAETERLLRLIDPCRVGGGGEVE